ncbi:MAG: LysM peptidoglycan-binding domain-containing protein, partial [Anaerolineaceae bacterium]
MKSQKLGMTAPNMFLMSLLPAVIGAGMLMLLISASPVLAQESGGDSQPVPLNHVWERGAYQAGSTVTPAAPTQTPLGFYIFQTATPDRDGSISHTVQSGEFLITIAQGYGISLDELLVLNNLTADTIIQPGQILLIKRGETPLPALTSGTVLAPTATLRPSLTPKPTLTPFL